MIVEVSGRIFSFPNICACCGGPTDHEEIEVKGWKIPYCKKCIEHESYSRFTEAGFLLLGLIFMFGGCQVSGTIESFRLGGTPSFYDFGISFGLFVAFFGVIALMIYMSRKAKIMKGKHCSASGKAVAYLGSNASFHKFSFCSKMYTRLFAEANYKKLINVSPELHRLLEDDEYGRVIDAWVDASSRKSVSPSVANVSFRSDTLPASSSQHSAPCGVLDIVDKLESSAGPVSRRKQFEKGLEGLAGEESRKELAVAFLEIEVNKTLEKVDSLKTLAAKKRNLYDAIWYIEGLDLPIDKSRYLKRLEDVKLDS